MVLPTKAIILVLGGLGAATGTAFYFHKKPAPAVPETDAPPTDAPSYYGRYNPGMMYGGSGPSSTSPFLPAPPSEPAPDAGQCWLPEGCGGGPLPIPRGGTWGDLTRGEAPGSIQCVRAPCGPTDWIEVNKVHAA